MGSLWLDKPGGLALELDLRRKCLREKSGKLGIRSKNGLFNRESGLTKLRHFLKKEPTEKQE
jgi:hypothetical protein